MLANGNLLISSTTLRSFGIKIYAHGKLVLSILDDGTIEFFGQPSEASQAFLNQLQFDLDRKSAKNRVIQKYYLKGLERAIQLAKEKQTTDLIEVLKNEIESASEQLAFTILKDE